MSAKKSTVKNKVPAKITVGEITPLITVVWQR